MIYLDNSATTKPYPAVLDSFQKVTEKYYANPSSIHQFGGETEKLLKKAREQAASLLNVSAHEIIFTSGGTEANNMAIKGIALEHMQRGKHIITTAIEHPSVLETCRGMELLGFDVTYLPVDVNGAVSVEDITQAIRNDTILISVMHVNNEIGSIQPIKEIGKIAKNYPKLFFHVDHVQGIGKIPLALNDSGIDLCSFSGHKFHGLKGSGILYVKKGTKLFSLLHGGGQEKALRSGTENVAGAVAMVKALRLIMEHQKDDLEKLYTLQAIMREEMSTWERVKINTPEQAAPHIMNISVPGIKPEVIIHMLGEQNIFISTKSACSSSQSATSSVLTACGFDAKRSDSGLRISTSYDNTESEIKTFLHALKDAVNHYTTVME